MKKFYFLKSKNIVRSSINIFANLLDIWLTVHIWLSRKLDFHICFWIHSVVIYVDSGKLHCAFMRE